MRWLPTIGEHMRACKAIKQMEWAGSYRRGRETIGDLDLLVVASDRDLVMDHFEAYPDRQSTIARGETKISIRVGKAFQVDMRAVEANQFGAALQYFTGSQAHNIHVRRIAKEKGLKINEYGVFAEDGTQVAGATEARCLCGNRFALDRTGIARGPQRIRVGRNGFACRS